MKRKPHSRRKRTTTKSVLRLPDLEHAKAAVLNSLSSMDAQRGYRHAIDEFVDWYCSEPRLALNRIVVLRYRSHLESRQLAPGTVNLRLGAVRRLAYEAADCGLLSADLAAGIRRVKGVKKLGVRLGNWLTAEQGQALWQAPDHQRLKGKRDRALLALLLACGLREASWSRSNSFWGTFRFKRRSATLGANSGRIDRGVEDSISKFIAYGTSYTNLPRLQAVEMSIINSRELSPEASARLRPRLGRTPVSREFSLCASFLRRRELLKTRSKHF